MNELSKRIDFDRIATFVHRRVNQAHAWWLRGRPHSEEPWINHLSGRLQIRRRCDVGVDRKRLAANRLVPLHRTGDNQTDRHGSDLAVTITVPSANFIKTAFLQFKVCRSGEAELRQHQLQDSQVLPYVAGRTFIVAVDRDRPLLRVASARRYAGQFNSATKKCRLDDWLDLSTWLSRWFDCTIGDPSQPWEHDSPEAMLLGYAPRNMDSRPWGVEGPARPEELERVLPAEAWMQFQLGNAEPE